MTGVSESNERQLEILFQSVHARHQYHRFQPEIIEAATEMDNVSSENIDALIRDAETFIQQNKVSLDKMIDQLIEDK
jgi:hypothetical protein